MRCEPCRESITGESTVGFHRTVLLDHAQTIVDAVKAERISRFFVDGGCDGADSGRNYFSDYAQSTPDDSFILTLDCGSFGSGAMSTASIWASRASWTWGSATTPMGDCRRRGARRSVRVQRQRAASDPC
jgi:hydroxylamine reductase (hybrid-cluster protein)